MPAARAREHPAAVEGVDCCRPTFEAIYEQHFAFVWRSARRLGVVESALEDVVQEVFLVVHRRLTTLERRSSTRSWLFGIVIRVVSDSRRSLRRKPAAGAAGATAAAAKSSSAGSGAAGAASVGATTPALISLVLATAVGVSAAVFVRSSTPANTAAPAVAARTSAQAERPTVDSSVHATTISSPSEPASLAVGLATTEKRRRLSPATPAAASARASASATSVEMELTLVGDAREALRLGDATRALLLLDAHARRYPAGALGEERDAMRVTSLCVLDRVAEARAAASRFLRAFSDSPYAARVRAACGSASDTTF